ncbi:hypothetical protein Tco_0579312 [Tanacetum coccineum]
MPTRVLHTGVPNVKLFYEFASNRPSSKDVCSRKRIITITSLKSMKWYDYGYLDEIEVRREDLQLYTFKEGRKAHLLEDKQILSVGVFDEVFLALGWHLEEIQGLRPILERTNKDWTLHQKSRRIVHTERKDGVTIIKRRHRHQKATASGSSSRRCQRSSDGVRTWLS